MVRAEIDDQYYIVRQPSGMHQEFDEMLSVSVFKLESHLWIFFLRISRDFRMNLDAPWC